MISISTVSERALPSNEGHYVAGARWPSPHDEEWDEAIRELWGFYSLDDDWDGLGATAPTEAVVDAAVRVAELLRKAGCEAPSVTATGSGRVLFAWGDGTTYSDLEIVSPTKAKYMQALPGQKPTHGTFPLFGPEGTACSLREQSLPHRTPSLSSTPFWEEAAPRGVLLVG
jgi:hypothetical protein